MSSNVLEQHKIEHHKIGLEFPYGYFNSADSPLVASGQKLTLNIDHSDFNIADGVLHVNSLVFHDPATVVDTDSVDLTISGQEISARVIPGGIDHALLGNLNSEYYTHFTMVDYTDLTDGGVTTLHTHCHSDLDCLQSNDHTLYYLSTADPISYSGQMITLNIDPTDFSVVGGILTINNYGIDHGSLYGLLDDDHPQYLNTARHDISERHGPLVVDHGSIGGLADDDHLQYLNTTRADSRYYTEDEENTIHSTLSMQGHTHDHGTLSGLTDNDHSIYATGVGGVPLTYAAQSITFNYSAGDFVTSGNDLRVINKSVIHGHLGNLLADDHPQYIIREGRAGGQAIIGGTGPTDFLIFSSTTHATKYYLVFGSSIPWMVYDEVNCRLGVGVATPSARLHIGSTTGDCFQYIDSKAGNQAELRFRDGTTSKWQIGKGPTNNFFIYDSSDANYVLNATLGGNLQIMSDAGLVGIGMTPTTRLTVDGTVTASNYASTSTPICAFRAYNNADETFTAWGTEQVQFPNESYDYGSNYNTGTHRFVAPQTGVYHFGANVNMDGIPDTKNVILSLYVNGAQYAQGPTNMCSYANYINAFVSADIYLTASQYVEVYLYLGDGTNRNTETWGGSVLVAFWGHKVL